MIFRFPFHHVVFLVGLFLQDSEAFTTASSSTMMIVSSAIPQQQQQRYASSSFLSSSKQQIEEAIEIDNILDTTTTTPQSSKKKTSSSLSPMIDELLSNNKQATLIDITLAENCHRPLGCTVEESLANPDYVFVTKIVPDGNADKAGMQVGDVIVQVTGVFGGHVKETVVGSGIDKVKKLVSSRPEDEILEFQIARGTSVLMDHEQALVELVANPNSNAMEAQADEGILNFIKGGYHDDGSVSSVSKDSTEENVGNELDDDFLVDNLYNMWAEDSADYAPPVVSESALNDKKNNNNNNNSNGAPKPWSSRSSPSGTFVRDPVSGEMRNIEN